MSNSFANTKHLDEVLSYILVKKMLTRVNQTEAYKLGLVDDKGRTLKIADNDNEKSSLGLLDKFIFKLKRIIGPRINELSNFLYVNSFESDIEKYLTVKGGVQNKAAIKRVTNDLNNLTEKYNMGIDEILLCLIHEESKNAR
tara:strand:- start:464 stop:889 length:426 start_codon:yes stop_codon:yes gene_type:complete